MPAVSQSRPHQMVIEGIGRLAKPSRHRTLETPSQSARPPLTDGKLTAIYVRLAVTLDPGRLPGLASSHSSSDAAHLPRDPLL